MFRDLGSPKSAQRGFSRWTQTDPLVLVVGAISMLVYIAHGSHGTLTRDLGIYSYAGQQVAEGVPPYLGILNRAGPLAHVLPGVGVLLARLGGGDEVVTMRVLFMLFATACVCATYLLGRDLFRSRGAGVVAAAVLLAFNGFIHYASNGPREKTPMTLFIVCALWAMTGRRWFTSGVFVSLATLCLQTAFFSTFAAVLVGVLVLAPGGRLRALVRVASGGLAPVAVLATWFALAGSLRASVDAFYVINSRYTEPDPLTDRLEEVWLDLTEAYGVTVWLLIGGWVALAVCSLAAVSRRAREEQPGLVILPALAVGLLAGLAWTRKDYDAWPDLFPLLPVAAVGVAAAFVLVERRLPRRLAISLAAVVSVAALALALDYAVSTRDDTLNLQRQAVEAVLEPLPTDATVISVEAPQPLVLTRRTNPTRHQMFRGGLQHHLDDVWPGGLAGFQQDLVAEDADLVAVGATVGPRWRAAIEPVYVYVGSAPGWEWYARASLGEPTLAELREAAGFDASDPWAQPHDALP